jgi:O-antigen/teichoic acid export membrane protein
MTEQRVDGRGAALATEQTHSWMPAGSASRRAAGVRRNFSWTLAGNVVSGACQWGQLIVLAKLVRPELVGQFALAFAITAPVMLAANLGLRTVQVTDARGRYLFADFVALRLITVAIALLTIMAIGRLAGFSGGMMALLLIVGASKGIDAVGDIVHGAFQQAEWMEPIGKGLMLNGAISLAALALAVNVTGSVVWGAVGSAFGSVVALLVYNVPVYRLWSRASTITRGRLRWASLVRVAALAAPLGVAYLLTSLNPNIPTYVIARIEGERDLGIYAALAYLTVAGHTVVSAAANVALPRLALLHAEGDLVLFRQIILKLIGAAVALGVMAWLVFWTAGGPLLRLVYRPEYAAYDGLLLWLIAGMTVAFVVWFLDAGLAAVHRFGIQAPINFAMVTTCSATCLLLIPRYGLDGAAWAVCLSLLLQAALKALVLRHALMRIRPC